MDSSGTAVSEETVREASRLTRIAANLDPTFPHAAMLACQLAIRTEDGDWLASEAERLKTIDPKNPWGPYFAAFSNLVSGDLGEARANIARAKALGLPSETYDQFMGWVEQSRSPVDRYGLAVAIVLGVWLAGFLLFLVVGTTLSHAALEASKRVPQVATGQAVGMDSLLRQAYQSVLWACCAYYFVSIPVVIGTVLLAGGGLVYLMVMSGHIPVKLLIIVVILTLVTLWAIVKSIFIRGREEDPGLKMEPGENPRLRKVLEDVAARIGTRAVTNVYLTAGAEMAVMERGGMYRQVRGDAERCLILGIGALDGMKLRPLRAILAHEYGHFSNRDTAGGGFALAVRRSLVTTAVNLARGGAAAWYNPAWLFVNGFYRLFLLVSQGASRLQEVLADRWAAFAYGSRAFGEGLRHIIDRSIRFNAHITSVLDEVIEQKKPLANLYSYRPAAPGVEEQKFADALEEAIQRPPSPYDSHPRPADRFAWVNALGTSGGPAEADDNAEAWTLFDNREELERRLTQDVRQALSQNQGIVIPEEGAPGAAA